MDHHFADADRNNEFFFAVAFIPWTYPELSEGKWNSVLSWFDRDYDPGDDIVFNRKRDFWGKEYRTGFF